MTLKSSQNRFTSPNKNDENDPNEQESHRGGSSHNSQAHRRRSRSFKKRNSKRYVNNSPPSYSRSQSTGRIVRSLPLVPMVSRPILPAMNPYYRGQSFRYPVLPDWNIAPRMRFQNPLYTLPFQPVHVPLISPRMLAPAYPYPGGYAYSPPPIAPILPPTVVIDELAAVPYYYQNMYSPEQTVPNEICELYPSEVETVDDPPFYEVIDGFLAPPMDHMDFYLSLPRELFPNAMMLPLDPNPIIDGFCKYNGVLDHAPWIMDLEFGVPREATSRPIAVYDVKYNSIHCKNAPNAIHPGFESCSPEFKSVLTFYYDCVISSWYKGYMIVNQDSSVENFQSWLYPPMQEFGMCWP